ncbi:DMT family transporter [Desulfonatronovibrio hydrogenovorans]|uniref:DMT family transporter n=1 Tax=Desulfonatronovibrio hydrogenovorans TaxID=53245 RepID=UPI00068C307C|nr:DMT family transporter [Desulfonatronovibrio hydrogenovorans]
MRRNTGNLKAYLALITAMFLWGSSYIALKIAFMAFDPMTAIFGRMLSAALVLALIFPRFRRVRRQSGDLKLLLLMGFFEPCLYYIFEGYALVYTSASQAGMVSAMLPLIVTVSAFYLLKERVCTRTVAGFMLAVAGGIWISLFSEVTHGAPRPVLGNFLEFLAICCAAGYTICAKYLSARYNPLYLTAVQSFLGTLFFFPLMLISPAGIPSEFPAAPSLAVLYLGVVVTLVAYTCYNYGVSKISAGQASSFINFVPVFTILLGWTILGERFSSIQVVGVVMVFAGVILSQITRAGTRKGDFERIAGINKA